MQTFFTLEFGKISSYAFLHKVKWADCLLCLIKRSLWLYRKQELFALSFLLYIIYTDEFSILLDIENIQLYNLQLCETL